MSPPLPEQPQRKVSAFRRQGEAAIIVSRGEDMAALGVHDVPNAPGPTPDQAPTTKRLVPASRWKPKDHARSFRDPPNR